MPKRVRDNGLPLRLGVKRRLSRRNDPREKNAREAFEQRRMSILERDNWTCRGCGFASARMSADKAPAGGMEVHHMDDDHHHNDPANLITLCPFCHMTFTLGRRGARFDATLGYEPRYTQAEINLLHHTIWGLDRVLAMSRQPESAKGLKGWGEGRVSEEMGRAIAEAGEARRQMAEDAEQRLKTQIAGDLPGVETQGALYAALQNLPPKVYAERERALTGLRLFPRYEAFDRHIELWARHIWAAFYPPSTWANLLESAHQYRQASDGRE